MITVNFRTPNGKSYSFEVDPTSAISDIDFSSKIPDFLPTTKFIHKGRNLQRSTILSSLKLVPNDFIVIYNPTQYQKHPKLPEDLNAAIDDEFGEKGQTRIYKPPDHPSVQPLPDISRPIDQGVQLVRGVIEPEIAGMSESLYGNPAIPQLYRAIANGNFEDDDSLEYDDDDDEDDINESQKETINERPNDENGNIQQERRLPPPQNTNFFGIEGSESLTAEDRQAITRLRNLTNLDEITIVQVFLACNKEEETTASCLFSMMD